MIEDVYPLSPLQEGIYYHWVASPESWINFEQINYRVKGRLNTTLLGESYAGLVSRHGILRTFFTEEFGTELLQVVVKEVPPAFEYLDVSGDESFSIEKFKESDRIRGFDLYRGSQMRLTVLGLGEHTYEFIWSFHHIIMDAWCISILINDFFTIYYSLLKGQTASLGKVYPYSNYIKWLSVIDKDRSLSYWRDYLAGYNTTSTLPKKVKAEKALSQPEGIIFELGNALSQSIRKLCGEAGITENSFIQAVWGILLSRYNNTNDVAFGSIVSGRPGDLEEVEKMVGLFINTIPMRIRMTHEMSVRELLKDVQQAFINGADHHYIQLAEIQAASELGRNLFDHIVLFENYHVQDMVVQDTVSQDSGSKLSLLSTGMFDQNNYDLTVVIMPGNNITIKFYYNGSVYNERFLNRVRDQLIRMIEQVVKHPDLAIREIDYLSAEEKQQLLSAFNDIREVSGSKLLMTLFQAAAEKHPDNIAVVYEDKALSYRELNEQSNHFAAYLREKYQIRANDRIGIQLDHSEWLIVVMLGVLKSGAAYVMLDTGNEDCKTVIDDTELGRFRRKERRYAKSSVELVNQPDDLICITYAPGTTGGPVGVMMSHAALWNTVMFQQQLFDIGSSDDGLQFASRLTDAFAWEVFPILVSGATLYIIHEAYRHNALLLEAFIEENRINFAILPPEQLQSLKAEKIQSLRKLITLQETNIRGKGLKPAVPGMHYTVYSPALSGMYAALARVDGTTKPVLFKTPVSNTQIYILGAHAELLPAGAVGEIYISGKGLAKGYVHAPALTAEKFVLNPFSAGELMYKTGDLGRWVDNGQLEYLGSKMVAPNPDDMDLASDTGYVAPGNETEEKLAGIWQHLLGKPQISIKDKFFELGGQSITAIKLASQIYKVFEVKIALKDLFSHSTIAAQAAIIQAAVRTAYIDIPATGAATSYPLSSAQRRLWVLSQFGDGNVAYNMPAVYVFEGALDQEALAASFNSLILRHESLRTVFKTDEQGNVRQFILGAGETGFRISYHDVRGITSQEEQVRELVGEESLCPFDLSAGPLLRAGLYQVSADKWVFTYTMHHIISDGWSMEVLIRELLQLYHAHSHGASDPLTPLRIHYKDYAVWQQTQLKGEDLQEHRSYWQEQLSGELPVLDLPGSQVRPAVKTYNGGAILRRFPAALSEDVKLLGKEEGCTLFMSLLSAVNVLLYRYTGQEDIIIGSPIAGREHIDLDGQIGFYVNMLALRSRFSGAESYKSLLTATRKVTLDAYAHQMYPFDELVDDLQLQRDMSRNALFDVLVVLQNVASDVSKALEGLDKFSVKGYGGDESTISKYDLTFTFSESGDGIWLRLEYNSDIYDSRFAGQLASHLEQLLSAIIARPDVPIREMDYLSAEEKEQLLEGFNTTGIWYPRDKTLVDLFEEQVAKTPDNIAVVFGNIRLSYRELNQRSNQLANYLRQHYEIRADDLVGIVLDRSEWMIISILGILKSGGAYVPADPEYPQDRIDYILRDSQCKILVNQEELERFKQEQAQYGLENLLPVNQPASLAYVIYTSGSTGQPKGALIEHRNVVRLFMTDKPLFDFGPGDVWTMFHSYCFDFSVWEMYGALLSGGKLVIVPLLTARDPGAFSTLLSHEGVTVLNQTPSSFYNLIKQELEENSASLQLRYVIFGGEALSPGALAAWRTRYPETRLINMYGITETTVHVTYKEIQEREIAGNTGNIGRPIPTLYCYVLDQHKNLLPAGVPGELYVGGAGVARGYLNRDALTSQRFIPDPFKKEERLYRSGDLVKLLENGEMEYVGRIDNQVKIRGYRVELGEIENALEGHAAITAAVVVARPGRTGDKELVAYVTGIEGLSVPDIRLYLSGTLPAFLLPAHYVLLDVLPLTSNGKVDKKRLPDPDIAEQVRDHYVAPEDGKQAILAEVWQEVLGIDKVGANDNFFNIGGNSISAIEIFSKARRRGIELTIKQMFETPTIAELSKVTVWASQDKEVEEEVSGSMELLPIQQWYFEHQTVDIHHFNYSTMFITPETLDEPACRQLIARLYKNHDALRLRFNKDEKWQAWHEPFSEKMLNATLEVCRYGDIDPADRKQFVNAYAESAQSSLSLSDGPLMKIVWFDYGSENKGRLLLIVHHLVVDGISWRILLEDINLMMNRAGEQQPLGADSKTTSYKRWSEELVKYSNTKQLLQEREYWTSVLRSSRDPFPFDNKKELRLAGDAGQYFVALDEMETRQLVQESSKAYHTQINDLLLTSLMIAVCRWGAIDNFLIDMEGHGREGLFDKIAVSRTVGWFTGLFPVLLDKKRIDLDTENGIAAGIKLVKENLRGIPDNGIGYGILRYLSKDIAIIHAEKENKAALLFNFLGDFKNTQSGFVPGQIEEKTGTAIALTHNKIYALELNGAILNGCLKFSIGYSKGEYSVAAIERFGQYFKEALQTVISHCLEVSTSSHTPSDFPYAKLTQSRLDELESDYPELQDVYAATSMQKSIFFHSLAADQPGAYVNQHHGYVKRIDPGTFKKALQQLSDRHSILRTSFSICEINGVLQVVSKQVEPHINYVDYRHLDENTRVIRIKELVSRDASLDFEFETAPLLRVTLIHISDSSFYMVMTFHHIILDGWSVPVLFSELNKIYDSLINKQPLTLPLALPYKAYISWLSRLHHDQSVAFWRKELSGLHKVTTLSGLKPAVPKEKTVAGYKQLSFAIAVDVSVGLKKQAAKHHVTMNTLLVAAWGLLLSNYTNEEEVVFGMTVSGRSGGFAGIESMVGLFINSIPFQVNCRDGQKLGVWLKALHSAQIERDMHSYLGLTEIRKISKAGPEQPLFESLLVHQNYPVNIIEKNEAGAPVIDFISSGHKDENNFPMTLQVSEKKQLLFTIIYQQEIFDSAFVDRIASDLPLILHWLCNAEENDVIKSALLETAPDNLRLMVLLNN